MTAREIASHRYGHNDGAILFSAVQAELKSEYRNLLLGSDASTSYHRFVKLVCQLLGCASAVLLNVIDDSGTHVARCDTGSPVGGAIGASFWHGKYNAGAVFSADDTENNVEDDLAWRAEAPDIKAYAGMIIKSDNLRLALLVALEPHARQWTSEDLDKLQNVSEMLRADLSIARERHQMAVQKRMQRSLVISTKFRGCLTMLTLVRCNLSEVIYPARIVI